jgi:CHAT domain-containing protein
LNLVGQFEVVHFAGHAVNNSVNNDLSYLALANSEEAADDGLLFGHQIASHGKVKTRLVVLSACRTAAGSMPGDEGPLSLAAAFLAAGVDTVVATLWPIADETSLPITIEFHRRLRSGASPPAALRAAQILCIQTESTRRPAHWAGFLVVKASY